MQKLQQQLVGLGQISLLVFLLNTSVAIADTPQTSLSAATSSTTITATSTVAAKDDAFINQLITAGIQPLYRELEQRSQQLTQNSHDFCKDSSLEGFQTLQDAWGQTMLAWQRTDSLLFGPATAEQIDFHINFTPPKKQIIKGLLDSDKPITAESITAAGVGANARQPLYS